MLWVPVFCFSGAGGPNYVLTHIVTSQDITIPSPLIKWVSSWAMGDVEADAERVSLHSDGYLYVRGLSVKYIGDKSFAIR